MNNLFNNVLVFAALSSVVLGETNPVVQCKGQNFKDLQKRITVDPCGTMKCKLTKSTNTTVAFKFLPTEPVKTLTNKVYADIGGFQLPFLGVTEQNACGNIQRADTGAPAPCPLNADVEYIYVNVFPIEDFYPLVSLTVHWSLDDGERAVICFEVPAVIKNGKGKKKRSK